MPARINSKVYLEPCQISMIDTFWQNSNLFLAIEISNFIHLFHFCIKDIFNLLWVHLFLSDSNAQGTKKGFNKKSETIILIRN